MWSNLQAAVPPDDHHLGVLAASLPDVTLAERASSTTTMQVLRNLRQMVTLCASS